MTEQNKTNAQLDEEKKLKTKEEARKKREAEEKKKKERPKPVYYTVKLETTMPVTLTYRVLAESPEKAADIVAQNPFSNHSSPPKHIMTKLRKVKATVYDAGTIMIRFMKSFK